MSTRKSLWPTNLRHGIAVVNTVASRLEPLIISTETCTYGDTLLLIDLVISDYLW